MRILVTGATGFLGGAVSRALARAGHDVLATGRDRERGAALSAAGLSFSAASLNDDAAVERLCAGREVVVHCAALSEPWGRLADFVKANVDATRTLVEACKNARVMRLVHISTPSIYMGAGDRENVREDDALPEPITHYAATKLAAEAIVSEAHRSGLPSVMLRPRAVFGPGDTSIFPRLIHGLSTGTLPRLGDGQNRVDLTYIDNAVQAVELAITAPERALGRAYNITNGEPVLLWDVVARVGDALALPPPKRALSQRTALWLARSLELGHRLLGRDQEPLLTRFAVEMLTRTMTLDITLARRELGYAPRVSMEQGLTSFLTYWQDSMRSSS